MDTRRTTFKSICIPTIREMMRCSAAVAHNGWILCQSLMVVVVVVLLLLRQRDFERHEGFSLCARRRSVKAWIFGCRPFYFLPTVVVSSPPR